MDETLRNVAWSIAEAWWRKSHRRAAGSVPEASTSADYADQFWQGWTEEAKAAVACLEKSEARMGTDEGGLSAVVARI